ncbi:hypothetical protein [Blastomonas natatoria]|uniref:hypothetical protein n=1 Tax=Blastomonas natatoria TaxID=34015 RepID=UPI0011B6515B|nr:hypothetical protein [Blastomonas natatoria]
MIDHSREQLRDFEHIVATPSIALKEKYVSGADRTIFGLPTHADPTSATARAQAARYWQTYDFHRQVDKSQRASRKIGPPRLALHQRVRAVALSASNRRLTKAQAGHIMRKFMHFSV